VAILEDLENLRIDAGVSYLDNEPLGRVVTVPLYAERYVLVTRNDHALAAREHLCWADLAALPLCLLTPDMQNRRIIGMHMAEAGVPAQPGIETNSTIVLISHVLSGGWSTILPRRAAEIFLGTAPLTAIPLVEPDAQHAVGLIAPWREPHTPVIAALLAEARRMAD
jgi:DNA-binding transcriptional LysR family regulator